MNEKGNLGLIIFTVMPVFAGMTKFEFSGIIKKFLRADYNRCPVAGACGLSAWRISHRMAVLNYYYESSA